MYRAQTVLLVLALALVLAVVPLSATTYVLPSDARFADATPLIVEGRIDEVDASPADGMPATEYRVAVDRVVKGFAPGSTIIVRVAGGVAADGTELRLHGAPTFQRGERALLFLVPHNDGTYGISNLMLGAFHRVRRNGQALALRNLSQTRALGPVTSQPPRDFTRFSRWLEDRAAGVAREPDYHVAVGRRLVSSIRSYRLGKLLGKPARWFEFDRGETVPIMLDVRGLNGSGGGVKQVKAAIAAWNNDSGSNIELSYAGRTDAIIDFGDGINAIRFGDPFDQIPGSFLCGPDGGGIGALAGASWSVFIEPVAFKSRQFFEMAEGDVVLQDGVECYLRNNPSRGEALIGHELGHVLGLGHSCEEFGGPRCNNERKDEALMRWKIHDDGRGALLGDDDRKGIACLYGAGNCKGGDGGTLAAPSGLSAAVRSNGSVDLAWRDNSTDETKFVLQMSTNGGKFEKIANLPANTTEHRTASLSSGLYSFRVRAKNADDKSKFSETVSVVVP